MYGAMLFLLELILNPHPVCVWEGGWGGSGLIIVVAAVAANSGYTSQKLVFLKNIY